MSVFSPLALTQTLPFLPLAQGDIDYEVARRGEPDLFAKVLAEPATKVILVKDGKVAVPHGQGAIADYANVKMRLAQLPGARTLPRNSNRTHRRSPYSSARTADDWASTSSPWT